MRRCRTSSGSEEPGHTWTGPAGTSLSAAALTAVTSRLVLISRTAGGSNHTSTWGRPRDSAVAEQATRRTGATAGWNRKQKAGSDSKTRPLQTGSISVDKNLLTHAETGTPPVLDSDRGCLSPEEHFLSPSSGFWPDLRRRDRKMKTDYRPAPPAAKN